MSQSIRNYFCAAVVASSLLSFAAPAHAASDIQMLPPTPFGSQQESGCSGTYANEMLVYSGNGNGQSGINCVLGVTGDAAGDLVVNNGTVTANKGMTVAKGLSVSNSTLGGTGLFVSNGITTDTLKFLSGATTTDVTNAVTNLAKMPACNGGEALTASGNGNFSCIFVADIPNVGTTTVPSCPTNQQIYFSSSSGFSCQPLPPSISCGADQVVIGAGSGNTPVCSGNVTADPSTGNTNFNGTVNAGGGFFTSTASAFAGGVWAQTAAFGPGNQGAIDAGGDIWMAGSASFANGKTWITSGDGGMSIASGQIVLNGIDGNGSFASGASWCDSTGCHGSSDRRLKKDIEPITNALASIEKLQGVHYKWRAPNEREVGKKMTFPLDKPQVGFIAQDVEKVVPEAVSINKDTGTYGLQEQKIVPFLVEGMKEQQKEIEELKAELAKLKQ